MTNMDDVKEAIKIYFGEAKGLQRIASNIQGKEFYDALIADLGDKKVFCKLETDYK
jgi:hypothetical protein